MRVNYKAFWNTRFMYVFIIKFSCCLNNCWISGDTKILKKDSTLFFHSSPHNSINKTNLFRSFRHSPVVSAGSLDILSSYRRTQHIYWVWLGDQWPTSPDWPCQSKASPPGCQMLLYETEETSYFSSSTLYLCHFLLPIQHIESISSKVIWWFLIS